jgi:hypothetical protein
MELAHGLLFVKSAKVVGGWLWHSGRIGNKPEFAHGYFGGLVAKRVKGRMENIHGEADAIALCGQPL